MRSRLACYSLSSMAIAAAAVGHAFATRKQFYNATIFMTTDKIDILILSNLVCMLSLLFGKALLKLFFGRLRGFEVENLVENGKYAFTETCLALTTFRQDIDMSGAVLFATLLFVKKFHWLLQYRLEHVVSWTDIPLLQHIRLSTLLVCLYVTDILFVYFLSYALINVPGTTPTFQLLFAFEFLILAVSMMILGFKHALLLLESFVHGGQLAGGTPDSHPWDYRPIITFYIDIISDLIRLFLYVVFFVIVCSYFGLPIHLIRELYMTIYTLRQRIVTFTRYQRLVRALNDRFPDASLDAIQARSDSQCIICREDMTTGKILPCTHIFHGHCLRTWLERANTCPICRAQIPDEQQIQGPVAVQVNAPVEVGVNVQLDAPVQVGAPMQNGLAMEAEPRNDLVTPLAEAVERNRLPNLNGDVNEYLNGLFHPAVSRDNLVNVDSIEMQLKLLQSNTILLHSQIKLQTNVLASLQQQLQEVLSLQESLQKLQPGNEEEEKSAS